MTRCFALKFAVQGGITFPCDVHLHRLAVRYAQGAFAEPINFTDYESVKVACDVDEAGIATKVTGVICRVPRYDYPVWRGSSEEAMRALIERERAALDDMGMRGAEVFVHIAPQEPKELRCPKWKKFLRLVKAEKASRWRVRV